MEAFLLTAVPLFLLGLGWLFSPSPSVNLDTIPIYYQTPTTAPVPTAGSEAEPETMPNVESLVERSAESDRRQRQQIEDNYRKFLKSPNKCEKKYWTRYEFGQYFQDLANRNKISAWDVANGDAYTRRNISTFVRPEISDNYSTYIVVHMPEAAREKFEKSSEKEEKAAVFNACIRRDYECYKRLK